jgi:hypothetical protein
MRLKELMIRSRNRSEEKFEVLGAYSEAERLRAPPALLRQEQCDCAGQVLAQIGSGTCNSITMA